MSLQISYSDLGVVPNGRQIRVVCPQCGGRKKTLGVDTARGLFNCFKCQYSGRVGGEKGGAWYSQHLERVKEAERERQSSQAAARKSAQALWSQAARPLWNDYLKSKSVLPIGLRQLNKMLIVPMHDIHDRLVNVQRIFPNGQKRFLKNGQVKGAFFEIAGDRHDPLYVCEGVATGLSLHMFVYPHARVVCAFSASNLLPVARALRDREPRAEIIVAADNDQFTAGNPGLAAGRAAATAVGGRLVYPRFEPDELASRPTDFNDMVRINRGRANG